MAFKVVIDRRAHVGIQNAKNYYDEKRLGLGDEFVEYLFEKLNAFSLHPFYQIRYENIRCFPLKRFPYVVHFSVDERTNIVFIHAVLHAYRNANYRDI